MTVGIAEVEVALTPLGIARLGRQVERPWAGVLRRYQSFVFVRGTMFALMLALGLAGVARAWRRFGGASLLPLAAGVVLLLLPVLTVDFDYRYLLPVLPLAGLAAVLGYQELAASSGVRRSHRRPGKFG